MEELEQRSHFVATVWDAFCSRYRIERLSIRPDEYELARRWAMLGVPLATVLRGIDETAGEPRTLMACERAVSENVARWQKAMA